MGGGVPFVEFGVGTRGVGGVVASGVGGGSLSISGSGGVGPGLEGGGSADDPEHLPPPPPPWVEDLWGWVGFLRPLFRFAGSRPNARFFIAAFDEYRIITISGETVCGLRDPAIMI